MNILKIFGMPYFYGKCICIDVFRNNTHFKDTARLYHDYGYIINSANKL